MVQGEIAASLAAILAGVIIPDEDFLAGEFHLGPGSLDHVNEANYRWGRVFRTGRTQGKIVFLEDFGLAINYEHDRASHITDIQRFVVLIKNEDCSAHWVRHLGSVPAADLRTGS
jgi:hypothetical protein